MIREYTTEAIEGELARLRAARPGMASRIDRAEALLTEHLRSENGSRPIKIRLSPDGHTYLVASGSRLGCTYTVEPKGWTCDCRSHKTCYHIIACWILEGLGGQKPPAPPAPVATLPVPCDGCGHRRLPRDLRVIEERDLFMYWGGESVCPDCYEARA